MAVQTIQAECRFCGAETWKQADDNEPECADCYFLALAAEHDVFEIELTLRPITEWYFSSEE